VCSALKQKQHHNTTSRWGFFEHNMLDISTQTGEEEWAGTDSRNKYVAVGRSQI